MTFNDDEFSFEKGFSNTRQPEQLISSPMSFYALTFVTCAGNQDQNQPFNESISERDIDLQSNGEKRIATIQTQTIGDQWHMNQMKNAKQ